MRRTHTTDLSQTELPGGPITGAGFDLAFRNLLTARREYDTLAGDSDRVPELSRAAHRLFEARIAMAAARTV